MYGEDDQGEGQHDQRTAAEVVLEEGEEDHPGDHGVGEQGPLGDLEEADPMEVLHPGEGDQVAHEEQH